MDLLRVYAEEGLLDVYDVGHALMLQMLQVGVIRLLYPDDTLVMP
jgi:hypothetical protein